MARLAHFFRGKGEKNASFSLLFPACPNEYFQAKSVYFFQFYIFITMFELCAKNFWTFGKKFTAGLSKPYSRSPEENIKDTFEYSNN